MPGWMRRAMLSPDPDPAAGDDPKDDPKPDDKKVWAGKYKTPVDLEKGYAELRKTAGLSEIKGKLVGKDGHFVSYDALEQAYKDAETLHRKKPDHKTDPEPKPKDDAKPDDDLNLESPKDEDESVAALVKKAGLDAAELERQFLDNGKLTPEQYAAIRKVRPGLSNAIIDSIAQGMALRAKAEIDARRQIRTEIGTMLGCDADEVQARLSVMAASVPDDERPDLAQRLNDPRRYKGAVRDILAFHAEKTGSGGDDLSRGTGKPPSGKGAKDRKEYLRALRNPGDPESMRIIAETPHKQALEWSKI